MYDKKKIETLFLKHYGKMFRLARMLLHDDEDARDVVYGVFASLMNVRIEDPTAEQFLMRCVRNSCINKIRDRNVESRILNLYLLETDEYEEDWPDEETIGNICRIIDNDLSPRDRTVVKMRYESKMKYREISEALKISETAVAKHLQKSFQIIRNKLKYNG